MLNRFLASLLLITLFVAACSSSVKDIVDNDDRIVAFRGLFPDARYAETSFSSSSAESLRDIVVQDCGDATVASPFTRATYSAKAATLAAYVSDGSLVCVVSKLNPDAFTIEKGDSSTVEEGVLVTVDGEPIMLSDLQNAYAQLPETTREETAAVALLNQLINQRLLIHASRSIAVGEEEVLVAAEAAWRGAGFLSEESFREALQESGGDFGRFLDGVRSDVKIAAYLDAEGITNVSVDPAAAKEFYLANPNSFLVAEQVRFRQLFFAFGENGSRERAASRLRAALRDLEEGKEFCVLVRLYSDDLSSRETCGEYVSPRGVLFPSIEAALFSLAPNQSTVLEGPSGYHIFVVLEHQPTTVIPYARAESQVIGVLRSGEMERRLSLLLLRLRADAQIVDYT